MMLQNSSSTECDNIMKPSFIEFLCLNEDTAAELAQLTVQRQQIILKKAAADKQFDQQIANLDRMIFQKERQKQVEDKKNGVDQQKMQQQQQQNPQQTPQQQGTQTTTPGSTGSHTPGSASSAGNNAQQVS